MYGRVNIVLAHFFLNKFSLKLVVWGYLNTKITYAEDDMYVSIISIIQKQIEEIEIWHPVTVWAINKTPASSVIIY